MVSSVDGAATFDERSAGLSGAGDRTTFRVLRSLADAIVVGARTATLEGYRQPAPDDVLAPDRLARDQTAAPALILLTRSLDIPVDYAPIANPDTLVVTCRGADSASRTRLRDAGATIIDCGDDDIDVRSFLDMCAGRGLLELLTEGGPTLLGAWLAADVVDEVCVATSPMAAAGDAGRISHHAPPATPRPMKPAQIITDDDGFVYTRWARADADAP